MIVYDWLLTFSDEIRTVWQRPMTGAKLLYLFNRYMFISLYICLIMNDLAIMFSDKVSTQALLSLACILNTVFVQRCVGFHHKEREK